LLSGFGIAPSALSLFLLAVASLVLFRPAEANHLGLKWDRPTTNVDGTPLQDLAGYRVYHGPSSTQATSPPCNTSYVDVPQLEDYHIQGLTPGELTYVQVTAMDTTGHESACSNEVSAIPSDTPYTAPEIASVAGTSSAASGDSGGGGGGGCFIATAAFGSPLAKEVVRLKEFRDRYLLTNAPGRLLVTGYYRVSPPIADWLRQHEPVRTATRQALRPVVWWAGLMLGSPAMGLAFSSAVLLVVPLSAARCRRRRPLVDARPGRQS
jgi:hypothetical protein